MQLLDVSVLDGKGLITIAIADIKDRIRLQDYFREAEKLFELRDETEAKKVEAEKPLGDTPCPLCNPNGAFKYGPDTNCICQGRAWMWKLG